MIQITAKREGFRRCGIAHTVATVEYEDNQFTKEQLACMQAEPMLAVTVIKEQKTKGGKAEGNKTAPAADNDKE
jgi:hypothetical protein